MKNSIQDSNVLYMNSMKFYGLTGQITKIILNEKEVTDYVYKDNVNNYFRCKFFNPNEL